MRKKPEWTFPDLPPFLAGLTLEHLARLRALIRDHGTPIGASPHGLAHGLKVREPVDAFMIVVGLTDEAALIIASSAAIGSDGRATIALAPGGETAVEWDPDIALADVLACLDADAVVKTSQLAKTGHDGSN